MRDRCCTRGSRAGAGLGGGSADAAAVLVARSAATARARRAALGSDVPFCLHGGAGVDARARRDHRADRRSRAARPRDRRARRSAARRPPSTAAWDELGGPRSTRAIDAPAGSPGPFVNDLEPAAEHVEPRLREFRARARRRASSARRCSRAAARRTRVVRRRSRDAAAARAATDVGATRPAGPSWTTARDCAD